MNDGRMFFYDPSRAASRLYTIPQTGAFERKETQYLSGVIQPGWTCFDVGACFGWYTVLFSQLAGSTGQVHTFEPVPANYECTQENLDLNSCENVTLNNVALGEKPGTFSLFLPRGQVSASLRAHNDRGKSDVLTAEVTTLDAYVENKGIDRVDFIKADIEGAELPMLRGAEETLRKFHPMLMLEVQASSTKLFGYEPPELFNFLGDIGYKPFYVTTNGTLEPHASVAANLPDYNFIFRWGDE